ncbi:potassium channel family protein [Caproiciproducens galactitolivorans]|uniref:TrkA family potassium uptake protein n=1 Tax=Caproiciproducens galactitolivorans TaxID=642589 RepID=A0ABT4BTS2_9FIRM|nr:TrkA family potassium uptake protein [Caproiciproducens galactitolivorans]MCY1713308.1 TrkA family potassium uptake protein [Caproiciproducens galactitolivorans]
MNVLVVGCGRLGTRLAEILDEHGHDVAVVDANPDAFRNLSEDFSGMTVTGMPMDMQVLQNAGVKNCDAVAVATPDDNLNITVSQIVREFFGVKNVVARISDPARENVFKRFGLKTVCPTKLAGDAMFTALTQPLSPQNLSFETATVTFHCRAVDKAHEGASVESVPMDKGETVFGVLHGDGEMELYHLGRKMPLAEGDQVIFAKVVD